MLAFIKQHCFAHWKYFNSTENKYAYMHLCVHLLVHLPSVPAFPEQFFPYSDWHRLGATLNVYTTVWKGHSNFHVSGVKVGQGQRT